MNKTLEHITENLERGGKTILRGGLRGTQKFLDAYSARLPWYFEKAPHYTVNEPHRTMIKNCTTCRYSDDGKTSCFRLMPYAIPKIDIKKGPECGKNFVHWVKAVEFPTNKEKQ